MENKIWSVDYKLAEFKELSEQDQQLVALAKKATFRSYAPYSNFKVGAAILLDNGKIIEGSNQENVAFPSGTCAERTAAFYAHANNPDAHFVKIAVAARGTDDEFLPEVIAPCGACRQSLLEYEGLAKHPVEVMLCSKGRIAIFPSVQSLLPLAFVEF